MRAVVAVAAGAILLWADVGRAQQGQTVLPDVSVTAPVPAPPRFSATSGKVRVEEEKWPEIPCDRSRIASGGAGKCQTGPTVENFMSGAATGGSFPGVGSEWTIAHHCATR